MEKTVSAIARPIKEQDRIELPFSLCVVRLEGRKKGLGLVEIQGKEGVRKDWSGFGDLEQTDKRADGKPEVALVANAKDLPQHLEGLAVGVREINHIFGLVGVFDLFLCIRVRRFEDPLGAVPHNQGKGNHGVDGVDHEAPKEEPILVCDEVF